MQIDRSFFSFLSLTASLKVTLDYDEKLIKCRGVGGVTDTRMHFLRWEGINEGM